jgi:cell division protein FtsB
VVLLLGCTRKEKWALSSSYESQIKRLEQRTKELEEENSKLRKELGQLHGKQKNPPSSTVSEVILYTKS